MDSTKLGVQVPDSVESVLEEASASCVRFNSGAGLFAGQYLAIGRNDGWLAICNVETKGTLRYFEGHAKAITSLSWSKYNRFLASASVDWNVIIWDLGVGRGERARTVRFDSPVSSVQFCPTCSKILIVVLDSQQAILVDLRKRKGSFVNGHINGASSTSGQHIEIETVEERKQELKWTGNVGEDSKSTAILSAAFTSDGQKIVAGTSKGDLLVFDRASQQLVHQFHAGSSGIRELALKGSSLITNSNDRVVRLFNLSITQDADGKTVVDITALHRFQDLVNRTPWRGIGFGGNGEFVFAGASHKVAHNIYIWDRSMGVLDKVLSGPRDSLIDVDWHPCQSMLASVSNIGSVNLWSTPPIESWSAYAPGFEELEENEVYQEKESEFDLEDEEELSRIKQDQEDAPVKFDPNLGRRVGEPNLIEDGFEEDDEDNDDCFIIPVRLSLEKGALPDLESEEQ